MITPLLFDTIELVIDLPEHNLRAGAQGAIVHEHADGMFEVEFANDHGETTALCVLPVQQFIVVWQAETEQWVPVAEQIAQIVARLPDEAGVEVLDFARFLGLRAEQSQMTALEH